MNSENLTTLVRFNAEIKAVWTDCQVQNLHNFRYTCKIIVENKNSEVTDYINNRSSMWFQSDRPNSELKLLFEFCVYPPRYRFNRSSLLRSSYIGFIAYFLFYFWFLLRTAKRRSDSLWKVSLKVTSNFFFTYKINCISFLRASFKRKNRFFENFTP